MPEALPKLLVVDDDRSAIQLMAKVLEPLGRVQFATSGADAVAQVGRSGPDLVLLDAEMPGMDGYATLASLHGLPGCEDLPIIFVTAYSDPSSESRALEMGAVDFIQKPISPAVVQARVKTHLALKRRTDEVRQANVNLEARVVERTTALMVAKEAAEAASRAKTTFLAKMSHELRTPMNGIIGMTDLALRRATDSRQKDLLGKALKSSGHLLAVLNDILDISKLEAERLTLEQIDFNIDIVLANLRSLLQPRIAEKGIPFAIEIPPSVGALSLRGDPLRLAQILLNLAENALKFTEQGSVTLKIEIEDEGADDLLLRFTVVDTGIGLSPDDRQRVFYAFEQADNSMTRKYAGSGLGLAIGKRLAKMMGGDIGVDSELGVGSSFWFTARLAKKVLADSPVPEPLRHRAEFALRMRHEARRFLLLDDPRGDSELSRDLLGVVGLQVDLAADGEEAVEMAASIGYDLILIDIDRHLPTMDGVEASRVIRMLAGCASVPMLAMTASADPAIRARCFAAGINDLIAKPVTPDNMCAALLRWLPAANRVGRSA